MEKESIVVPVYIRSAFDPGGEPCLLGSNIAIPLGLMVPGDVFETDSWKYQPQATQQNSTVTLVQAPRVRGKCPPNYGSTLTLRLLTI